jgi:hypothetical protein
MDLKEARILETAAEMLSDFKFSEEELGTIFRHINKIYDEKNSFQPLLENLLPSLQEMNVIKLNLKDLTTILNDESCRGLLQNFFSTLLANPDIVQKIQDFTIRKIYQDQNEENDVQSYTLEGSSENSE